jgi:K+-sensing histidine kinase KdpD
MTDWDREFDPAVLGQALEMLAHDLRNPLSALHSNLGFLNGVPPSERGSADVADAIADGLTSCEGLSHIIGNLGAFAQLLRGVSSPSAPPVPVVSLVQVALNRCAGTARSHGTEVAVESPEAVARLHVSSGELASRAIVNLLLNSIHCSQRRSSVCIEVGEALEGRAASVTFLDTGPPLAGSEWWRLDAQLAAKATPSGRYSRWLGLYIASVSARVLGGELIPVQPRTPFSSALRLILPLSGR